MLRKSLIAILLLLFLALGCSNPTADEGQRATHSANTTQDAATALEAAIKKKDDVDQRLGRLIARVGPMMMPEQHGKFVKAFEALPDVAAANADYHARAIALDAELTRIMASDTELATVMAGITARVSAGRGSVDRLVYGPQDVVKDYEMLAQTPYATGALKFAVRLLSKDPRLAKISVSDEDIVNKIFIPALSGAFLENLLRTGEISGAKSTVGDILNGAGDTCREAAHWLHQYNLATDGDITSDLIRIKGVSIDEGLRTIAGIIAIWDIGANIARGDLDGTIQSIINGGTVAISGVAAATSLFRRVVLGIDHSPLAEQIIKFSGRIGKGITLIISVFTLAEDAGKWNESLDAKVRVAADVLAITAGVIALVSSGPVGGILAVVSLGISFLADWLEGRRIDEEERRDLAACLPSTGIPADVIATMIDAEPVVVKTLTEDVKLTPSDFQWLIALDPDAVTMSSLTPIRFIGLQVAQMIWSLDSAEVRAMLTAGIGSETRPEVRRYMADMILRAMEFDFSFNGDLTKAQGLAWFADEANNELVPSGEMQIAYKKAFQNARAYLVTK